MLYILGGIDQVRTRSTDVGPGGFSSLIKTNHSLNQYANTLIDYRFHINDQDQQRALSSKYQNEFNIVWGNLEIFNLQFHGKADKARDAQLLNFKHDASQFLQTHEAAMEDGQVLSVDQVSQVITDLRALREQINTLGREYFYTSLTYRDDWVSDINKLHNLLYFFSTAMIGAACLLVALLIRSNARKNSLVKQAITARHEKSNALNELRSGRLEQRAKDSFIASASHDLSQPLHAIGLFLGSLDNHITDKQGRETLRDAIQCSNNIGYLFKSLLDISRLDAGIVEVDKKHFYLDELINMLEQEYRAKTKNAGFDIDIQLDNTVVHSDPILLSRIVRNLIENAIAHSKANLITISCSSSTGQHFLVIEDNGCGISESEQKSVFSEYYQIGRPTSMQTKGLGLGLSIVQRLTELLGTSISLTSQVGVFTRFTVGLPQGVESKVDRVANADVFDSVVSLDSNVIVAVVDDDENICSAMSAMLSNMGIESVTATTTDALIDKLIETGKLPHLIVADYRLSKGQTGDQAIVQLKRALKIEVPALLVTGDTSPHSIAHAASSGFDLLQKPIAPMELSAKIMHMLHTSNRPATQLSLNKKRS